MHRALIFQIPLWVCRNWHLGWLLDCWFVGRCARRLTNQLPWLPRFQRAGPSTSLDELASSVGIQLAGIIPHLEDNVKRACCTNSNSKFGLQGVVGVSRGAFLRALQLERSSPKQGRWEMVVASRERKSRQGALSGHSKDL
jgi:hypothetical protein